jgi:AAA domain
MSDQWKEFREQLNRPIEEPFFPGLNDIGAAEKWTKDDETGAISSMDFENLEITPRTVLVDDWCRAGDLGFIFAARGLGKTWLAMHLAHGLATKSNVGPWLVHQGLKVLYVDGEMSASDIQFRDRVLGLPTDSLFYLNHEILFERTGRIMNLADLSFQAGMVSYCEKLHYQAVFLDNLSTLASGVDENKAIDWEIIQPWLLKLRRSGITVIFIHHAGRNNELRGSSKREDPAAWILRLDPTNKADDDPGAHFISHFTKWRGAHSQPKNYEWHYRPGSHDHITVDAAESSPINIFRDLLLNGLDTCTMIADEMHLSPGHVSRLATQAENAGWLQKKGRKYVLV